MKVKHSKLTEVRSLPSEGGSEASDSAGSNLAGAVLIEGDPFDYYAPMPLRRVDEMLENRDDYVFGSNIADLDIEIEKRHPCEMEGLQYVLRQQRKPIRWLVLDRPYGSADSIEELYHLWVQIGRPIYTDNDWSFNQLDDFGFVARERKHNLLQVNYNPRAIELRGYRKQRSQVKKRRSGVFPQTTINGIFRAVSVDQMPHRYSRIMGSVSTTYKIGWGRESDHDFDIEAILLCLDLAKKLGVKVPYWREYAGTWREAVNFESYLQEAILYVHSVEDSAYKELEAQKATVKSWYQEYVNRFEKNPEEFSTDTPMSFDEYLQDLDWNGGANRLQQRLRFCRWLRAQARAMKIKMPRKPVMPKIPPKSKHKRKRK